MLNEFTVVGEHREDKSQFLVIGADGQYYEYNPAREQVSATVPDEHWEMIQGDEELPAETGSTEFTSD
jgi:hypothetical protein